MWAAAGLCGCGLLSSVQWRVWKEVCGTVCWPPLCLLPDQPKQDKLVKIITANFSFSFTYLLSDGRLRGVIVNLRILYEIQFEYQCREFFPQLQTKFACHKHQGDITIGDTSVKSSRPAPDWSIRILPEPSPYHVRPHSSFLYFIQGRNWWAAKPIIFFYASLVTYPTHTTFSFEYIPLLLFSEIA